mgnify:CR=1 FL=1
MAFSGEGGKLERRYLDMKVDTVQKRTGDAGDVFLYCMRRAGAGDFGVSPIAAGTGIHRCHEHHRAGIGHAGGGAGDCDLVVLNGLAQNFQCLPLKFGQLVQKEHTVVCKGDFSGNGAGAPPVSPAGETVWCGERNGRVDRIGWSGESIPATE